MGGAATGGVPVGAITQGIAGTIQSVLGAIQQNKALKDLNKLQSPTYTPNQSIMNYYNKALSRYGVNPTDSALYKRQTKNALASTAQGLGMLQNNRSGQAGVSSLLKLQNDSLLNAEVAAENQQNQRFGQLGSAAGMKAGEEGKAFDINQYQPFERKYNLLAMKAGGGAQIMNAGLSNIFGAASSFGQRDTINKTYGG